MKTKLRLDASDRKGADIFRVLALPVDRGGCGWYRVRQFQKALADSKEIEFILSDVGDSGDEVIRAVEWADLIITRPAHAATAKIIKDNFPEKKILFDHDDNTFVILPSNDSYRDHGTKEVSVKVKGKKVNLWKDGVDGFDLQTNKERVGKLVWQLENATMNTAPTKRLATFWAGFNNRAAPIPNVIDFDYYPNVKLKNLDKKKWEFRIGWSGGASHAGDFKEAAPHIAHVMEWQPTTVFYSVGSAWPYLFGKMQDRVKTFGWIEFQAHPYRLKSMDLDAAVIPLQNLDFNTYKSEIKFLEFAALKVPTLTKRMLPYEGIVIEGVTGLMYETGKELEENLDRLIKDGELRKKLAKNAYEWVRENRNLEKLIPDLVDFYKKV